MIQRAVTVLIWVGLAFGTAVFFRETDLNLPGHNLGYAPRQPIAFSHRLHSGELGIDCQYCHTGAEKTRFAAIPDAGTCMNCHRFVTAAWASLLLEAQAAEKSGREPLPVVSPELEKLYTAVGFDPQSGKLDPSQAAGPVRWVRVHRLPDHVSFDHRRHVNAGVECRVCHGAVEAMEVVQQVSDLSMGWCVNCHRSANRGEMAGLSGVQATTDCGACHY
ncbi:MAG: hypothetical protein Kow001_00910 [Acidobacteriota bacterium]